MDRKLVLQLTDQQLGIVLTALSEQARDAERGRDPAEAEPFRELLYGLADQAEIAEDRAAAGEVLSYRVWAMPNRYTFLIKPIRVLLRRYVDLDRVWIDPFAGFHSPCRETNDINPAAPTKHHLQAVDFVKRFRRIDGVLFDPPYSPRQIQECYRSVGLDVSREATQNARLYREVRREIAGRMKVGGIALSFGWNSTGFGKKFGFRPIEIMHVAHGGGHNDTIVVVEVKEKP